MVLGIVEIKDIGCPGGKGGELAWVGVGHVLRRHIPWLRGERGSLVDNGVVCRVARIVVVVVVIAVVQE